MYEELLTLRQHRNRNMLSIRALAVKASMGSQTIVKIERGERVRPSSFAKLALALNVKPEEIQEFMRIVMRDDEEQMP